MPTSIEFLELVESMTRLGIPQEKAEAEARRELGMLSPLEQLRADADRDALEDEILERGDELVRALGFAVIRFSQKRRSKVTEGIPDRRYYHVHRKLFAWWEAKASWGEQRPAQRSFQELCDATGDPYILGGLDALKVWLTAARVVEFDARGIPEPLREPAP